jgi:hypothetical protein
MHSFLFRLRQLFVLLVLLSGMSGCILVPFVQAFKETGLTEGDRMALLPAKVKKFSDARVFGNKTEALSVVAEDSKVEIANQLQTGKERERIVKSQIDNIEWLENAYKARVVVSVESFTMSQLIVQTTSEEQQWEFSSGSGWLLTSRTKLDA